MVNDNDMEIVLSVLNDELSDLYNLIYSTKDRSHFIKVSNSIIKSPSDHILEVGAGTGLSSEILYQFFQI